MASFSLPMQTGAALAALICLSAPLASVAHALDLTLENVVIRDKDEASNIFEIGKVAIKGANLTQDELATLFAQATPDAERRALALRLNAQEISAPEAVLNSAGSKIVFTRLLVRDVAGGGIARASIAGVDAVLRNKEGVVSTLRTGELALEGADVAALLGGGGGAASFSRFALESFVFAAPDEDTPLSAPGGNLFSVKVDTLALEARFDGDVLVKSAVALKKFSLQPPATSEAGRQFAAAGFDKLDLDLEYAATYDPARKALSLDRLSIKGGGAGSLQITARFGDIDKSLMTTRAAENAAALLGGHLASADVEYSDAGLAQKTLEYVAREQKKTPAALRAEAAAMARQFIPVLSGGPPNALTIAESVSNFITAPSSISVALRPKNGQLNFLDAVQMASPDAFLTRVDVEVRSPANAAPAAAIAPPAPARGEAKAPPAPARLEGLAAWATLVGKTIAGKNSDGEPYYEFYRKDGVVKQLDGDSVDEGEWTLKGQKVCLEFADDDEPTCYKLVVEGDIATFTDDNGKGSRWSVLPGNPKKL